MDEAKTNPFSALRNRNGTLADEIQLSTWEELFKKLLNQQNKVEILDQSHQTQEAHRQ